MWKTPFIISICFFLLSAHTVEGSEKQPGIETPLSELLSEIDLLPSGYVNLLGDGSGEEASLPEKLKEASPFEDKKQDEWNQLLDYLKSGLHQGKKTNQAPLSYSIPPLKLLFFDYIYQPNSQRGDGEFNLNQFRLGIMPKYYLNSQTVIGAGIQYSVYQFDFEFDSQPEFKTFHTLGFPLDMLAFNDDLFFWGRVQLGIHSDFQHSLEDGDLLIEGGGLLGYEVLPKLWLGGGIFFSDDFGEPYPVPIGGLYWTPSEGVIFNILAPKRASVSFELLSGIWLYFYYEVDGGQVRFVNTDSQGSQVEIAQFSFFRITAGLSFRLARGIHLNVLAGSTVRTRFEFRRFQDEPGREFTGDPSGVFTVSLSVNSDFVTNIWQGK